MRMIDKRVAIGSLTVTVLTGCSLGVVSGDDDQTATTARQLFDQDVYPIVSVKCIGCHGTNAHVAGADAFVDGNAATAYVTATGYASVVGDYSASAPILSMIQGGHQGLTYTSDEVAKITAWLAKEVDERGTTGSRGVASVVAAWSGCMDITDFHTANMAQAWGTLTTLEENETCESCHVNGDMNFIATIQEQKFFDVISQHSIYLGEYFRVDPATEPANPSMIVNTLPFVAVGTDQPGHIEHPMFDPINNAGMTALAAFYQLIMARQTAATCSGSTLVD
jgi:hypothetical protein